MTIAPLSLALPAGAAAPALEAVDEASRGFARFAADIAAQAASTLAAADRAAVLGVQGQASLQEVVGKLMAAERTLQTSIALRDRFVASLQEISRMQI